MNVPPAAQDDGLQPAQVAHWRHELLTSVNHVLGLTEIQMEEAEETGFGDCVPALSEINTSGRMLMAIIQNELSSLSRFSDLQRLDARIESEARPTLGMASRLAERLHAHGFQPVAEDMDLVSSALETLLALSHEIARIRR